MNPLKSESRPRRILSPVRSRTLPCPTEGSKMTRAPTSSPRLLPCSVSFVPSGTFTVEDGDGVEGLLADAELSFPPPLASLPPEQPPRTRAEAAASATRDNAERETGER